MGQGTKSNGESSNYLGVTGSLLTVMQVVLLVLKWSGTIDWAWWIVLVPALIPVGVLLAAALAGMVISTVRLNSMKGRS